MSLITPKRAASARRCLFGRPDPQKTTQWLNDQLAEIKREEESKWGFDFANEVPIAGSSSGYEFVVIESSSVPNFYRQKFVQSSSSYTSPELQNQTPKKRGVHYVESDSDTSMDCTISPVPNHRRHPQTPKRSGAQSKMTDFLKAKKRLRRSPKTADLSSRNASSSDSESAPSSPRSVRV